MRFGFRRDPDWRPDPLTGTDEQDGPVRVRHYRLRVAPPVTPGRLVFLSDLHWTATADTPVGHALAEAVNRAAPDWLLFGGDLTRHLEHLPPALRILERLQARRAKLAVPGNWERMHAWFPVQRWQRRYGDSGFRLLVNEVWTDPDPDGPVVLGVDDWRLGRPQLAELTRAASRTRFTVLLTHSPDAVARTSGRFLGHLVLAGHTHGGQIRVPGFGAAFTSSHYWKTFEMGWFRRRSDGTQLFVTAGLGCTGGRLLRRRLFCPPEIVVLDVASESATD